jgi:TolB-like protein
MSLISELKRRNVFRVGLAYLAVAWLLLQFLDVVMPMLTLPDWVGRFFLLVIAVGFPFAIIIAWAFELTPEGIRREADVVPAESMAPVTGRRLDFIIIAVLGAAVAFFVVDKFFLGDAEVEPVATAEQSSPVTKDKSIAVLPFVNMSSDPEQEFFSDGITEEILNTLAAIEGLKVSGRTSSFSFKGKNEDLIVIAEKLGVANVLEGSVRKSGNKLRITAQLIKADDGFHLWSNTYDRELTDIFDIQEEIASEIANQLRLELGLNVARFVDERRTDNADAFMWFVRGGQYELQANLENNISAVRAYRKALDYDPDYVSALVAYTSACLTVRSWGVEMSALCDISPADAAERAIRLAPESVEAQVARATVYLWIDRDMQLYRATMEAAQTKGALNRDMAWAYAYSLCMTFGEYDECFRQYEDIYKDEPLDVNAKGLAAEGLMRSGRIQEAKALLEAVLAFDPEYSSNYYRMGYLQASYLGNYKEGIRNHRVNLALDPAASFLWSDLVEWHLELGDPEMAARYTLPTDATDPDYLAVMSWYFLALYANDRERSKALATRLAGLAWAEDDFQWFYNAAWLLDYQQQDPQGALEVYRKLYPNLMRPTPVVGYWNHGAAITLAVLRQEEGDGDAARHLLDDVALALKGDLNAFSSTALVAVHVLNRNKQAALQRIRELISQEKFNAWWQFERVSLFAPLWDEPEFQQMMGEIRVTMSEQLKLVKAAEAAGEFKAIPPQPAASIANQ